MIIDIIHNIMSDILNIFINNEKSVNIEKKIKKKTT